MATGWNSMGMGYEHASPCKNCPDRFVKVENGVVSDCHTTCKKYLKFKADLAKEKHEINLKKVINSSHGSGNTLVSRVNHRRKNEQ